MKFPNVNQYPATILVGHTVWGVKFVRRIEDECLGMADNTTKTLYVKLGQTPRQRLITFIHEVLHAFEYEYDFDLTSKKPVHEREHAAIEALELAILNFILDNPAALLALMFQSSTRTERE